MRVYVRSKETKIPIWFAFPTGWLLNRVGAAIVAHGLKESNQVTLEKDKILRLFKEIKRLKKKYPRMELVDVKTTEGERVKVRL